MPEKSANQSRSLSFGCGRRKCPAAAETLAVQMTTATANETWSRSVMESMKTPVLAKIEDHGHAFRPGRARDRGDSRSRRGGEPRADTPSQAGSPIVFENVSDAAGLSFVLDQHPTPEKNMVETMAGGVAVFDYDGDGLPDIFFTNGAPMPALRKASPKDWNRLFRNLGGLRFTDVTEAAGVRGEGYTTGAAAGDYDNDGHVDLFVAGVQRNQLLHNTGGRFQDVTATAGIKNYTWSVAAGWFDYDNDGWLDLFIVNYVDWTPETNKFCGDRAKNLRVYCHPKHYAGLPNALYRNRHDGTFEDVTERSGIGKFIGKGMSVAFADYDGDGFMDVFVTNDAVPNFLFHNRRDGTFEEVGLLAGVSVPASGRPVSSMGVDFRDYDNDGRPDIVVTALTGETFPLYKGDKSGIFRDVTYESGLGQEHGSPERMGRDPRRPRQRWVQGSHHGQFARERSRRGVRGHDVSSGERRLPQCERTVRERFVARRAGLHGGTRASRHRRRRLRRRRPPRCRRSRCSAIGRSSSTTSAAPTTAG